MTFLKNDSHTGGYPDCFGAHSVKLMGGLGNRQGHSQRKCRQGKVVNFDAGHCRLLRSINVGWDVFVMQYA
jgi:hypothetical protein